MQIKLKGMEFYAYHGHLPEEQVIGRYFSVDVTVETAVCKAMETDNLEDTVDYHKIYTIVNREMLLPSHLLEHLAQRIIGAVKTELSAIDKVEVCIRKNNPPLGGKIEYAEIQIIE
jgi:dihydroneopterin aldolase